MKIEGYEYVQDITLNPFSDIIFDILNTYEVIDTNDAMWHYMTTGQVEGQEIERTAAGTEEGTNHES